MPGYVTDILNGFALEFLARPHAKPFLLYLAHKAVHPDLTQNADGSVSDPTAGSFVPAERHKTLYANATVPRRPNHGKPPAGKPALERRSPTGRRSARPRGRATRRSAIGCACWRRSTRAWARCSEALGGERPARRTR